MPFAVYQTIFKHFYAVATKEKVIQKIFIHKRSILNISNQ